MGLAIYEKGIKIHCFPKKFFLYIFEGKARTFLGTHFSENPCIIYRNYLVFVLHCDTAIIKNHLPLKGERIAEFIISTSEQVASQNMQWKIDLTT